MLKMSFSNGTLNEEKAKEVILNTDKELRYTHGLSFRKPSTYKKPITKEEAIRIIDKGDFLDIDEYEDYIHLNTFSDNDLW
jgi:hypothetical protein